MDIVIRVAQFLLSISLLVILHELGHFIPAKLFKTKVEKFYLFFDAKYALWKKKIGETEYGIGWVPFGGYVKIAGMIDESMDTDQMKKDPEPWEFRSKPTWQRLIIMIGGVVVNILVAMVIYIGILFTWGDDYVPMDSLKGGLLVTKTELAKEIQLQNGDKIYSVDGERVVDYQKVINNIIIGDEMVIDRNGEMVHVQIPEDFINSLLESDKKERLFYSARIPFIVGAIVEGSANKNSDLQLKDRVMSVNGESTEYFDLVGPVLSKYKNQEVKAVVLRDEKSVEVNLFVNENGKLGVQMYPTSLRDLEKLNLLEIKHDAYSLGEAIPAGVKMTYTNFINYVKQFKKIINPDTGAYKGVGGMIKMTELFPSEWNWRYFWNITAVLSIMLAFLNILPIPALDGGHVMFVLYEMITGRKPSQKVLEGAQVIGFFIVMGLIVLVNGKDVIEKIMG